MNNKDVKVESQENGGKSHLKYITIAAAIFGIITWIIGATYFVTSHIVSAPLNAMISELKADKNFLQRDFDNILTRYQEETVAKVPGPAEFGPIS